MDVWNAGTNYSDLAAWRSRHRVPSDLFEDIWGSVYFRRLLRRSEEQSFLSRRQDFTFGLVCIGRSRGCARR
jgi:hypothetical protein